MKRFEAIFCVFAIALLGDIIAEEDNEECHINKYDPDAIAEAKSCCQVIRITNLVVPGGKTLDLSNLSPGTTVLFRGKTVFQPAEWAGPLLKIGGHDVDIVGDEGSTIDGSGPFYWDGLGTNGGKKKPSFIHVDQLTKSNIRNLNVKNSPWQAFSFSNSEGIIAQALTIDNREGNTLITPPGAKHGITRQQDTIGFRIASSNKILITKSIVYNNADCFQINSGTNIQFLNSTCNSVEKGGVSIEVGLSSDPAQSRVKGVHFMDIKIHGGAAGIWVRGGTSEWSVGSIEDVFYEKIEMDHISRWGINIQGDYSKSQVMTGRPTKNIPIKNLKLQHVFGEVNNDGAKAYVNVVGASGWKFENIHINGGNKPLKCVGIPEGVFLRCK